MNPEDFEDLEGWDRDTAWGNHTSRLAEATEHERRLKREGWSHGDEQLLETLRRLQLGHLTLEARTRVEHVNGTPFRATVEPWVRSWVVEVLAAVGSFSRAEAFGVNEWPLRLLRAMDLDPEVLSAGLVVARLSPDPWTGLGAFYSALRYLPPMLPEKP